MAKRSKRTPQGCQWRTVMSRPVLIHTKTGVICGGNVPRTWQGVPLQARPWEMDRPQMYHIAKKQLDTMFEETVGDLISELRAGEGPMLMPDTSTWWGFKRTKSSNPPWFVNSGYTKKQVYRAAETRRGGAWKLLTDEMERRFERGDYGEGDQLVYLAIMQAMNRKPISKRRLSDW